MGGCVVAARLRGSRSVSSQPDAFPAFLAGCFVRECGGMKQFLCCVSAALAVAMPAAAQGWDEGTTYDALANTDAAATYAPAPAYAESGAYAPSPAYADASAFAGAGYESPALGVTMGAYAPTAFDTGIDPVYSTPGSAPSSHESRHAFVPCSGYFERLGSMRMHGGRGKLTVMNAFAALPLNDPSRTQWMGWTLDAKLSLRETWLDSPGAGALDENRLTTVGLHASVAHALGNNSQVQVGFTPNFSTDFDQLSAQDFFVGGYAAVSCRASESLSYSVGVALMPDYYEHYVLPLVNFRYVLPSQWELSLQASRLSLQYSRWQSFRFGPFAQWNSAVWTVHHKSRTEQLRMSNILLGLGAEGVLPVGGAKLRVLADAGTCVHNTVRIKDKTGDHTREKFHASPGFYCRAGLGLQF